MINLNYNIWLQTVLGAGAKTENILNFFSSAEEIYRSTETERKLSGVFTPRQICKMAETDIGKSYEILENCAGLGVDVVTMDSSQYPAGLLQIPNAPIVLYVKGDIKCLSDCIPISIVGTRNASARALSKTFELSGMLSNSGFCIVSGGALGIDSAAHAGAIHAKGKTVAVLGAGIGAKYLQKNAHLRTAVSENGAILSEYPPFTEPHKGTFPMRNRLIAGLSVGTVVVEAGIKSGSLITAKFANEQGHDVFAVPDRYSGRSNEGVKELLRDGAKPVFCAMDILSEYIYKFPEKVVIHAHIDLMKDLSKCEPDYENYKLKYANINESKRTTDNTHIKSKRKEITDLISDTAVKVYNVFENEPLSINNIAEVLDIPVNSILSALTELEIYGYINLLPDNKYILKQEG